MPQDKALFNLPGSEQIGADDLKRLGISVAVLLITLLASRRVAYRLRTTLQRGGFQINVAILLARVFWIGAWTVTILLVLSINGIALTPLAAFIGVIGLAASLSLQQVLQNLVAGVYLLAERPFRIGDTVSVIGPAGLNHEGTVEDIQMRTTHLRSHDDELILVPNSAIFSGVVTNRTAVGGYARQVTVTFPRETDPESVRNRLIALLEDSPAVLSTPRPDLRIDKAGKESWTGNLLFWTVTPEAKSNVIWAVAHAFPEATVNDAEGAT